MRRRPQEAHKPAIKTKGPLAERDGAIGIVLSGGGARAAYQVGALKALIPYLKEASNPVQVIVGSSIGAINGLILGACLKDGVEEGVHTLEEMWKRRTFRNSFGGSPSVTFFKAIRLAVLQYLSPGPNSCDHAIFDPTPLMEEVDSVVSSKGGLGPDNRAPTLGAVGVMTTVEGERRRPLLFVSSHREIEAEILKGATFDVCYVEALTGKHGFASAALPAVLPPVELDTDRGKVKLVDGGISINVPVDPAVRLGAERVILVDISGRTWWLDQHGEPHDTRPNWEVPAEAETFCLRPPISFTVRCRKPLGPILKAAVGGSNKKFISAVGPTWPIYSLLKNKMGEDIAYETLSYVALDPDYTLGLIERGYNETVHLLRNRVEPDFTAPETSSYNRWMGELIAGGPAPDSSGDT